MPDLPRGIVGHAAFRSGFEPCGLVGVDRPIPTEMPFADAGGAVAVLLRKRAEGEPVRGDERLLPEPDDALLQAAAPMVAPCEKGVTRRRAHARRGVGIGEADSLRGEPVDVRRGDFPAIRVVAGDVTVAEVVGVDQQEVGLARGGQERRLQEGGGKDSACGFHRRLRGAGITAPRPAFRRRRASSGWARRRAGRASRGSGRLRSG